MTENSTAAGAIAKRRNWRHLVFALLLVTLVGAACASSDSGQTAQPTTTDEATATPTAVEPTPTPIALPTSTTTPTPVPTEAPTATPPPPTATAAPTSTPAPAPTATTEPTATAIPAPTATAAPVSTATSTPSPPIWVGCRIEPERAVTVGEILTYTALQNPVTAQVSYVFDHGDGTLDPGPVSEAFYREPGFYTVQLQWTYAGTSGTIVCGQVRVHPGPGTPTPTPSPAPPVAISCTIEPSRTVIVGQILTYTAVQSPATIPISYVFDHGDGTLDPGRVSNAFYEAPGFYSVTLNWSYEGRSGAINCGIVTVLAAPGTPTPGPTPTSVPAVSIGCQISPQRAVTVNETLTYTALQNPLGVPVQYVFDHGDGTLDAGPVSFAFYPAAGTYTVRLNWAHSGQSGQVLCGVVTVTT